jgi:HTH-type transcriptional regulator, competence development regulator
MKIEHTQEWWLKRVDREGDQAVSAGLASRDPGQEQQPSSVAPAIQPAAEETRIAFGRFVTLMRRQRALSIEKLAETAELDVGEIVSIEDDLHYMPEPRTVFRLAQTFHVSQQRLMQLAGLVSADDAHFRREAVRFAARSESVQKLTDQERAALEAFIAVLSQPNE